MLKMCGISSCPLVLVLSSVATGSRSFRGVRGVHPELVQSLGRKGIHKPNEIQAEAIALAVDGSNQDILVNAQTGSGKTLVFLLPILSKLLLTPVPSAGQTQSHDRSGRFSACPWQAYEAVVLAPTPELVLQHEGTMQELCPQASPRVLVTTAEDLMNSMRCRSARSNGFLDRVGMVAIDEVDAVLCGEPHDSRVHRRGASLVDLLKQVLKEKARDPFQLLPPASPQFLLATAFLTDAHASALSQCFPRARWVQHTNAAGDGARGGLLVPTLRQRFHYFGGDKDSKLLRVLDKAHKDPWLRGGGTIIFSGSAASAEHVGAIVADAHPEMNTAVLHAGMSGTCRAAVLAKVRSDPFVVLACTDVVARGIDFPLVRHVIMYDLPTGVAAYIHGVGRTARRGKQGVVTCLVQSQAQVGRYRDLHALQHAARLY